MKRTWICPPIMLLVLASCRLLPAPTSVDPSWTAHADCSYYEDAQLAWQAVGVASAGLAGAAGTGAAIWSENEDAVLGLSVSAAALGVLGTVAGLLSGEYARRYSERCVPRFVPEPSAAEEEVR